MARTLFFCFLLILPLITFAQNSQPSEQFVVARVQGILEEHTDTGEDGSRTVQIVQMHIVKGEGAGADVRYENGILEGRADMQLHVGEKVVMSVLHKTDGETAYILREKYRLNRTIFLIIAFFAIAVLCGGKTGFLSAGGLAVSIGILIVGVVPAIIAGHPPLFVSLIGCVCIAITSLFIAHGWNRRTSVALLSTLLTLGLATVLAQLSVGLTKIFGFGSEESVYLQAGTLANLDLKGLLLAGIIIGCLGVLDDITTAQTAAVDEVSKANPRLSPLQLWHAGMSVGREHIASLINTLALAYVGASLPLLLILKTQSDTPLWVILNSEFLTEEVVRTVVGSVTLLFAVPLSTWCAIKLLPRGGTSMATGHVHAH